MLLELEEPPLMDGWMRIATGQIPGAGEAAMQWHSLDLELSYLKEKA